MLGFITRRTLLAIPVLLGIIVVVFFLGVLGCLVEGPVEEPLLDGAQQAGPVLRGLLRRDTDVADLDRLAAAALRRDQLARGWVAVLGLSI